MKIYVDGALYDEGDARISVLDNGFRFGAGLRGRFVCRDGRFFRLDEHIDWLKSVAEKMTVEFPWDVASLKESVAATYDMNRFDGETAVMELILTAGMAKQQGGKKSEGGDKTPGSVVIIPEKFTAEDVAAPIKLESVDDLTISAAAIINERHLLGRGEASLVKLLATEAGADGGIVLGSGGAICACSEGELFAVSDGRVWTIAGSSESFEKRVAVELLEEIDYPCSARPAKLRDLTSASECFIITELFELVPVAAVGKNSFGDGNTGAVTAAIGEVLHKKIDEKFKLPF